MNDLALRLLARVRVAIDEPLDAGEVPTGRRRVIPIADGVVSGEISGTVVPLGADWNLLRADGSETVSARYLIRTTDGVLLSVLNEGVLADRAAGRIGVTSLRIEAPVDSPYAWLNDAVLVGRLDVEESDGAPVVMLGYWSVEPA